MKLKNGRQSAIAFFANTHNYALARRVRAKIALFIIGHPLTFTARISNHPRPAFWVPCKAWLSLRQGQRLAVRRPRHESRYDCQKKARRALFICDSVDL